MKDIQEAKSEAVHPSCRIVMKKASLHDIVVDKPVTLSVSGTVKSLHPLFDNEDLYEVEISDPKVEREGGEEEDSADSKDDMATMPLEHLKKHIMKALDGKKEKDNGNE